MSALPLPEGFQEMSVEEKITYVQDLWDLIASTSDELDVSPSRKQLLRERLERHRDDPTEGEDWGALKARLKGSL